MWCTNNIQIMNAGSRTVFNLMGYHLVAQLLHFYIIHTNSFQKIISNLGQKSNLSRDFELKQAVYGSVQWTLVITNSLGQVKLLCYIKIVLYPGCKNNKMQRNFELWDQENYFVISGFCYISVLYNESPLYWVCNKSFDFRHLPNSSGLSILLLTGCNFLILPHHWWCKSYHGS